MDWLTDPHVWIGLVTLTALEIVLGIDNIVFISILASKLPSGQQPRARRLGLALAMVTRILLLCSLAFVVKLTKPILTIFGHAISGRDMILIAGGLFLLAKSVREIHERLEGVEGHRSARVRPSLLHVIITIALLDIVFSLDSVITAVGMVDELGVMIAAVILAVCVMLLFSNPVSDFVETHPTIKMLALSFLLLIGTTLIMEGVGIHVPKGYVYFAMGFSLFVEMLNLRMEARQPVRFRRPFVPEAAQDKARERAV